MQVGIDGRIVGMARGKAVSGVALNSRRIILRSPEIRDRAAAAVAGLSIADPPWEVEIRPYRKSRSLAQNALYWMWVDAIRLHILESTGKRFSKDELHDWLATEFLPTRVIEIYGRAHSVRSSTSSLSVTEMASYMGAIEHWAGSDLQCALPHPIVMWEEAMGLHK